MSYLVLIKPDAIERKLAGLLLAEFEGTFDIFDIRFLRGSFVREPLEQIYDGHKGQDYWDRLMAHLVSGPIIALDVSEDGRTLLTPREFTLELRKKYGAEANPRNLLHCSDDSTSGIREVSCLF